MSVRRTDVSWCGWGERSRGGGGGHSRQGQMQLRPDGHEGDEEAGNPGRCPPMQAGLQRVGRGRQGNV